jgi:hypothetical protein
VAGKDNVAEQNVREKQRLTVTQYGRAYEVQKLRDKQ